MLEEDVDEFLLDMLEVAKEMNYNGKTKEYEEVLKTMDTIQKFYCELFNV